MKASDAARTLERLGCRLVRHNGGHRLYVTPQGTHLLLTYHSSTTEVSPWHLRKLCRRAGVDINNGRDVL